MRDWPPSPIARSSKHCTANTGHRTSPYTCTLRRYFFHDSWNILDTATICCVVVALPFRLQARFGGEGETNAGAGAGDDSTRDVNGVSMFSETGSFFMAQVLFAAAAPLLFSRILSLSQIDDTLGTMTQIIWTMLSHLARFSVFVAVLVASFALAFRVIFSTCDDGSHLSDEYGSYLDACLTMFKALLGDFSFDGFKSASEMCYVPAWVEDAGVVLLVVYLIIMSILLLNLLIAILATVHSEVHADVYGRHRR